MEENAQEATRKATQFQHKYHTFPYQNQNFISISRKNIVPLDGEEGAGQYKNSLLERDEHRTPTLRNTAGNRTPCWMTSNPMNDVNAEQSPYK